MVLECEYILLVKVTASSGYPRSFMMANSLAWPIDPKAFLKSIYSRYMSLLVKCTSSKVAVRSCNCLDVHLSTLNPSWLSCKIWYLSPYAESMDVSVLVKSLYIVLARAIGLWFDSCVGLLFLYKSIVLLIFYKVDICICL